MQLIALDDLNGGLEPFHDAIGKGLPRVTAIDQQAFDSRQIRFRAIDGRQSAVPVADLSLMPHPAQAGPPGGFYSSGRPMD